MMIDDIPDPVFLPGVVSDSAFVPPSDQDDDFSSLLYKDLMTEFLKKFPELNPTRFRANIMSDVDFSKLELEDQKEEYRKQGIALHAIIRNIFEDEKYIREIAIKHDCTFIDIFRCIYAYYGALLFKKPQFVRWVLKTLSSYSDNTKELLGLPQDFTNQS